MVEELKLRDHVTQMKSLSRALVDVTYPRVSIVEEFVIMPLKHRTFYVDGYEINVSYNFVDYEESQVESVQIQGVYHSFLPFNLVCKVAMAFLGKKLLNYIDFIKDGKKVYCWIVRFRNGKPIKGEGKKEIRSYEGLKFAALVQESIDLTQT